MSTVTEEIRARIDLVELIGRTVALKRAGSLYKGLCPFHNEKTPSFYVRPQTQTYRCFGCDRSGSVFDWLMEREHLEFGDVLRMLADMAGVALPERRDPEVEDHTRQLYSIVERAQSFYAGALWGSAGARARAYVTGRGLSEETLRTFGIGYAPSGNQLLRYFERDGFSEQDLQAAGLIGVTEEEGRPYDFFRDRVLFPIRDARGRTIAFGGRSLDDASTPKYLNSRDTLLFHKHETLFAIDLARKPMAQARQVVIVEGYMDAAMAHQHGYRNVVATLGTAITERHLRLLSRQVDEIRLALDPDAAGQAAMLRALQVADQSLRSGFTPVVGPSRRDQRLVPNRSVRLLIMKLPDGKDPDELIRSDPHAWPTLVGGAVPVLDFVLQQVEVSHDLTTPHGRSGAAREMIEVLAGVANPIEQDYYTNAVAARLNVREDTLRRLLKSKQPRPKSPVEAREPRATEVRADPLDTYLLALLTRLRDLPEANDALPSEPEFILPESRALFHALGGDTPAVLEPYAQRVQRQLELIQRLSTEDLWRRLEETRLNINRRILERKQEEISAVLKRKFEEEGSLTRDAEVHGLTDQLVELAQQIGAIDRALSPERERAGTR